MKSADDFAAFIVKYNNQIINSIEASARDTGTLLK
jgi:hypothetical protein